MKGLNDIDGAIKVLSHAIELENDYMEAYYELGEIYVDAEQYDQAAQTLLSGLEVSPEDANCHYLLGMVMLETEHPREAKVYFTKCIKLVEDNDDLKDAARDMLKQLR